jgi:hypothetical protein
MIKGRLAHGICHKPIYHKYKAYEDMMTKGQKIVFIFGGWVFLVLALLLLFTSLSLEYFFVLCLIGFLIIVELSGPYTVRPKWRLRVNIFILVGTIIFAIIVAGKVLDILGISIPGLT